MLQMLIIYSPKLSFSVLLRAYLLLASLDTGERKVNKIVLIVRETKCLMV